MWRKIEHHKIERISKEQEASKFQGLSQCARQGEEKVAQVNTPAMETIEVGTMRSVEICCPATDPLCRPHKPARECPLPGIGWANKFGESPARDSATKCEVEP